MDEIITLAMFTPAEAERITGVNTASQRDWRRRGYLPANEGHARFDVFQLARMLVLKVLSDRGIGPAASVEEADWCAAAIVWAAMGDREAWDGQHDEALTWVEQYRTPPPPDPFLTNLLKVANEGGADVPIPEVGSHWSDQRDYLRRRLWAHAGRPRVIPAPLFIWWADGSHTFHASFDAARGGLFSTDPRVDGPVIVLDMDALGAALATRAGRPLVHVEFVPAGEGDSPMEFGPVIPLNNPVIAERQTTFTAPGASAPGQIEDEA
jgi:hypothetical protein